MSPSQKLKTVPTSRSDDGKTSTGQLVVADRTVAKSSIGKPKPKRTKVKTGCFTCRLRRVKCDEAKPFCKRCIKFGVDCDGYPAPSKSFADSHQSTRALAPKYRRFIPQTFKPSSSPYPRLPTGPPLRDEQEARCFKIYCEEVAEQIRGPFKTPLWDQLIPQISEEEPFIRHAIIAIGAVSKFTKQIGHTGFVPHDEESIGNLNYAYALKQYDKALAGMRKAIANRQHDMSKALIACVLVFCFETLSGKPAAALVNAESGLMLLHQSSLSPVQRSSSLMVSFVGQAIEEGIMIAFAGLDLHVLFFLDSRPDSVHEAFIDSADITIRNMPSQFSDLRGARNFWCLIMRRNFHFIKMVLTKAKAVEMAGPWTSDLLWGDAVNLFPGGSMFSTPKEPPMHKYSSSIRYREESSLFINACSPLFERAQESGTQEEKCVVALIGIHELMSQIMLAGCFFTQETEYDVFLPQFKQIMTLIEYVHPYLSSSPMSAPYKFDLGVLPASFLVGSRCRDVETRDRAINVVMGRQYREGFWDSVAEGIMLCWLRSMENEGRDSDGSLKEENRAFLTTAYMDLTNRRGIIGATRRKEGSLVFLEREFSW